MTGPQHVAIIGAGLAGLSLALALHDQGIQCDIYETRPKSYNLGGAIMVSVAATGYAVRCPYLSLFS